MKGIVLKIKSPKNFHSRKTNITYFFKRYGMFCMFLFTILVGMAIGIYVGVHTDIAFKENFDFLFPTDFAVRKNQDFVGQFSCNFAPMFLFFISVFLIGFCPWGNIVTPLITAFKGFGMGLTLTALCSLAGMRGFGFFMLGILPGFFLISASLSLQGEISFKLSTNVFRVVVKRQDIPLELKIFVAKSGTYIFLALISAFLDTILFMVFYSAFNII